MNSLARRSLIFWSWFVKTSTGWLPDMALTMRLRGRLYGLGMASCGKNFQVGSRATLIGLQHMHVGNNVYLAPGVVILSSCRVTIEDEVMVAYYSVITDGNHTAINGSYRFGPRSEAPVHLGRGAWIAANCTLLPGVVIGSGALVAANSAVSRDVDHGSVVGGVPAKALRAA